jgi:hypothetical protein
MSEQAPSSGEKMDLHQGDLGLLESDLARRLLVMPTFLSAPHVRKAAARVEALRANPAVAITIDTEGFPPEVLLLRGRALVTEVDGVPEEYALAARRYMGEAAAATYLAQVDQPGTRMARIAVRPTWVGVIDFQTRRPAGMGGVTGREGQAG